jgi:hypothetical protein
MNYFYYDRSKSIELLQYYFFVKETYFLLLKKNTSENILIQEFLDSFLHDYVFWQSREIYLESMENFVARKWNGSEFVSTTYYILLSEKRKSRILETEFEKQERLELNPEIFQFSKVIKNFEDALEPDPEFRYLTEDHLPKVRKYFTN